MDNSSLPMQMNGKFGGGGGTGNKGAFNLPRPSSPLDLLGVSGPTLLEGVLCSATFMKQLSTTRNRELVDAAQNGHFQSILALTIPIDVYNRYAGTFGSMHTRIDSSVTMSMTKDGNLENMQSVPVSGSAAQQLLRIFLMLPYANLNLLSSHKNGLPGDPLKKLHDAIFSLSPYDDNENDDNNNKPDFTRSNHSSKPVSWSEELQKIYRFALETNIANNNATSGSDEQQAQQPPNSSDLKFQWWPTFVEDIINPKTNETVSFRFWLFVPQTAPQGLCESLRMLMADADIREAQIKIAIENLFTKPGNKKKASSIIKSTTKSNSKKKNKQSKKKFKQTTLDLFNEIAEIAEDEAEEAGSDEDLDNEDPMSVDGDNENTDTKATSPDNQDDDPPLRKWWEGPLLDTLKSLARLKTTRSSFINAGDVLSAKKKVYHNNNNNNTLNTDRKGKSKIENIYDNNSEDENADISDEQEDAFESLDDLIRAVNQKKKSEFGNLFVVDDGSSNPFGKQNTFEVTGYSSYSSVNNEFNLSGYASHPMEKSNIQTEDCNSILNPSNIFSVTSSMSSWTNPLCDPIQRDYRSYFDMFDDIGANKYIPDIEKLIHSKNKNDPHKWVSDYIKDMCPDIKNWPSYSAALGYIIRKTLKEYLHNQAAQRIYNSQQYSHFEALHFKGFPKPERVWVISPIITPPWRFDIVPRPDFTRRFPFFQNAVKAVNERYKFLDASTTEYYRNIFKKNAEKVKPNLIVEYEYPRIALQILYGLSFDTLKTTACVVNHEAQHLPLNVWSHISQQHSATEIHCRDNPIDAQNMATVDLASPSNIGIVLSVVSNVLNTRFLQLASCLEYGMSDSATSRGLLVNAKIPSTVPIPWLEKATGSSAVLQKMESIDLESFFRETNAFLHFRWIADHLEKLKAHIFNTPVLKHTTKTENVRLLLNKQVTTHIQQLKEFLFEAGLQSHLVDKASVPLTSVSSKAVKEFEKIKNTEKAWNTTKCNSYSNLDVVGEGIVRFVIYLTDIHQIHSNIIPGIILRAAYLAALRYTPSSSTQFPNVLMPGSAGTGKSILLKAIADTCMEGSVMEISTSTAKAFSVNGSFDDLTLVTEEAGQNLFGSSNSRNNEVVTMLKQRTEAGRVLTLAYDNSETNAKGGASSRSSKQIVCSCQGSNVYATNENLSYADKALLSRFLILVMGFVNEMKLPKGFTLQDRSLQGARDAEARDIINKYGSELQVLHMYVVFVEKMIQSKVIKDVEMGFAIDLIANVCGELREIIGVDGVANRNMGHIRWCLRTLTIQHAIYSVHLDGLIDIYKYNTETGQINPYTLEVLFREIPKYLFATKELALEVLTLFSGSLDKPLRTDIMRVLAREAYPSLDLENAKFWNRNVGRSPNSSSSSNNGFNNESGGKQTTLNGGFANNGGSTSMQQQQQQGNYKIDRNYIVVSLPGANQTSAFDNLGRKLTHIQLTTAQISMELKSLLGTMVPILPENDQNGVKGIPALITSKPKLRKNDNDSEDSDMEESEDDDDANNAPNNNDNMVIDDESSNDEEKAEATRQYKEALLSDDIFLNDFNETTTTTTTTTNIMSDDASNSSFDGISRAEAANIANKVINRGGELLKKVSTSHLLNSKDSSNKDIKKKGKEKVNTQKKRKRIKKSTKSSTDAEPILEKVSYNEANNATNCCDPIKTKTEAPLMFLEKDAQGFLLAIRESELRKYLKYSATSDEESPLMNSIQKSLSTSCLEVYPDHVLDILNSDECCGGISPKKNKDTKQWIKETNRHEYLICNNDTRDIVAKIRDTMPEEHDYFPKELKVHRFLRTITIKRDLSKRLRLYNFTGPSEEIKNIISNPDNDPLVKKSQEKKTIILEHDIDYLAYKRNAENNGADPDDPTWLRALPRFTKLTAINFASKRDNSNKYSFKASYPETPIRNLVNAITDAYKQEESISKAKPAVDTNNNKNEDDGDEAPYSLHKKPSKKKAKICK